MKSQIDSSHLNQEIMDTIPLVENVIQTKDDRLVKRGNILPNLVSCDLISDDQSLLSSRTLSGESQCLENYSFVNIINQQPLPQSVVNNDATILDQVNNIGCDNGGDDVIFGFKGNNFYDPDIQSIKSMDGKFKQTNERRAGRPPLDRSDYFCQICSATKTPQWRYISVCSVESKLRVCNACWMKQRKKRDGKCLPLQMSMNNGIKCVGISNLLKTSKLGANKENFDPQRQNYSGNTNVLNYKVNNIISKNILNANVNKSNITVNGINKENKVGSQDICEDTNNYVNIDSTLNNNINCNNNVTNNNLCIKTITFRSSPYSINSNITYSNNQGLNCSTCGSNKGCYCSSIIGKQPFSLSSGNFNELSESSAKSSSRNTSTTANYCRKNSNISVENLSSIDTNNTVCSNSVLYRNNDSNNLLEIGSGNIQNIYSLDNQINNVDCMDEQINTINNFSVNEQLLFELNSDTNIENNDASNNLVVETLVRNELLNNSSQSPEKSPTKKLNQNSNQTATIDSYTNRIANTNNINVSKYNSEANRSSLIPGNKLSVSTPVHHQTSTTVSPNTNYCNISSYTSSPCQSFATYDGPFLEDPNKTMYISVGTYFCTNADTNRWNEEMPVQSSVGVLSNCIGNSNETENHEKVEPLSFALDQDIHNNALSQNNVQIEQEQSNYTIFNKQMSVTESWSGEYLPIDMFSVPATEKNTLSSETSTTSSSHYSIGSKIFTGSVVCTLSSNYPTGVPQESEHSSQNDCTTWDLDSSSIACIDTWQNPLWYDSYSNGYCKLT